MDGCFFPKGEVELTRDPQEPAGHLAVEFPMTLTGAVEAAL